MSGQLEGQLVGLAVMVVMIGFGIRRRMRAQPVLVGRLLLSGGAVALLVVATFLLSGTRVTSNPLALLLAPLFVLLGAGLGAALVRTLSFWWDDDGRLWMKGGAAFAGILVATIALRFAVRAMATGSLFGPPAGQLAQAPPTLLNILSADLLFLTLGLWGARAVLVTLRARRPPSARAVSSPPSPPV